MGSLAYVTPNHMRNMLPMKLKNSLIAVLMTAAALALAVTTFAQTTGLTGTAHPLSDLDHACVASTPFGNTSVRLSNQIADQGFTSCMTGFTETIYLMVKEVRRGGTLEVGIQDRNGNTLGTATMKLVQGFSGILPVNIKAPVAKDQDYRLFLQTRGNAHLVLHSRNMTDAPHALYVDGWALSANLSLAVGFKAPMGEAEISRTAEAASVATVDEPAVAPVPGMTVFPNPFIESLNLSFQNDMKGECRIEVIDMLGYVAFRETRSDIRAGESVNIVVPSSWKTGVYSVRVMNGGQVTQQTVIKR